MHIAIDARIISSSTGRYIERLVYYLQEVDTVNQYSILVRSKDINFFKPSAPNFTVKVADFADYSFAEQIGFKKFLDKLAPDLVHFCMPQQPILYKGKHVTTVHDLNLLKTYNSDKNWHTVNQYSILVRSKDINFFKPSAPNFTVKVADFADYSFAEQIGFKKFLDKLAPDLVHFCMPQQPILYKGKHVTTVHDLNLLKTYNSDKNWLVFHLKQLVGRYVFKKISKTSSHIIVPSQFTKDEYVAFSGIPEEKVTLAYEAADISTTSPQPYKQPFKDFIMYVGQQSDYKNIKRLGDAHQKLLAKHPDLGLILVGRKNAPVLKNEAYFNEQGYILAKHPDLGLILVGRKNAPVLKNEAYFNEQGYKNILFTDFIEDPQRDWLFTKCKAYVFPSLMEGFGLPPLEAMGRGAPVISSSATCLPEINGDAAKYFDPTNVDDMAKTIEEVIYDETLRQDLVKKGFLQIKKYSWRKMARQTHQVYLDALND